MRRRPCSSLAVSQPGPMMTNTTLVLESICWMCSGNDTPRGMLSTSLNLLGRELGYQAVVNPARHVLAFGPAVGNKDGRHGFPPHPEAFPKVSIISEEGGKAISFWRGAGISGS